MSPTTFARLGAAALAFACAVAALRSEAAPPVKKAVAPAKKGAIHASVARLAPLDEYFGRLKMSVLGVRNKVTRLGLDADLHPEHDAAVLAQAVFVEDAMRDWARKYPYDRWLPRYAYALETMYERIPGPEAHRRAVRQVDYITAYFPATPYARIGRAKLVTGLPTPIPGATTEPDSALRRLALIDGKVRPTMPPAPVPVALPVAATTPTAPPLATPVEAPIPDATPTIDP
jgi:hypothetical protein